ncbi:MAG: Crp/Fnr family transcriptional regulator [Methylobacterium sp.]|nr:Crp/Fnr family transcriptional regulator [Methylobacterium sp.]MCA3658055.1 Crp/Fnr family transcriptional regulator [Methylobacterium sp.]MCA3662830.1 Crp/Fnr family transcriptional regulator [Methylobacterium sp.]MCA3667011.1 Crp/Fnr family transcriptional regulator [Methylobacterium sp.]MCA3668123.1 Crp/Fnr family transcriptional regulator [Methylobacterium sp.]
MRLDDVIFLLKALPLFRQVESEALRLLAFSALRRPLRAGDILFRKGELSDGGFLVLEGEIILDASDSGAPSPNIFRAGALIGQAALFAPIERPATALARERTQLLVLTRDLIERVLDAYPRSAIALRDAVAEEVRQFSNALSKLSI